MPLSMFRQLGLGELHQTTVILQLADISLAHPEGVIENVLVQVGSFIFPVDFIILDYEPDQEVLFIFGRSFLATCRAIIDVCKGKMTMRVGDRVEVFNMYKALRLLAHYEELSMISVVESDVTLLVPYMSPIDPLERSLIGDEEDSEDEMMEEIEQALDMSCNYVHGFGRFEELDRPVTLTPPKPSIKEAPRLELKPLPAHLRYAYLGNSETFSVIISSSLTDVQEEKLLRVLREHKKAIGWTIADIKGISPSFCLHKIFLEDGHRPGYNQIVICLEDQERTIFTCPYGTFSFKRMSFGLFFGSYYDDCLKNLSKVLARCEETNLGTENQVADHLSRLENHEHVEEGGQIKEAFPDEQLFAITQDPPPWYADYVNYLVSGVLPPKIEFESRKRFLHDVKFYYWDEAFLYKQCANQFMRMCIPEKEVELVLYDCHASPYGGHHGGDMTAAKVLQSGFFWPTLFKDAHVFVKKYDQCQRTGTIKNRHEMPLNNILEVEIFDVWGIDFMGPFPLSRGNKYILLVVDYVSKWVEEIAFPTNDAKVVAAFVKKNIFSRFGTPRALISDEGTHFCNRLLNNLLAKYGVRHSFHYISSANKWTS
ncbi:uncharacterized protein [Nicotiana tomentosiformis]|uniref:uncharacterized protein n=1 Tax=Nicotiana tomentosiformis TaxID=4098 RepID=UPI00388CE307